jgi:hypothetical protein
MQVRPYIEKKASRGGAIGLLVAVAAASGLLCGETLMGEGTPAASEAQVKAVFLFNFAKYVEWPAAAFAGTNAPFTIGVVGEDRFEDNLRHAVANKTINGRRFVIKHFAADEPLSGCQILFISDSEAPRMGELLNKVNALPILTVGEDEQFAQKNGIISFVLKEGKVRLEINLTSAGKTGLTISSKLLAVADVVKGKAD